MTFVLPSLQDPLVQQFFFLSRQGKLALGRGHDIDGVITVDTPVDFGLFEVSRGQPDKAVVFPCGLLEGIQPKVRFLIFGIRAVAFVAFVREDWPDVMIEVNLRPKKEREEK